MDGIQRKTLSAVFAEPPVAIEWEDIEDLLVLIGCTVVDDDGERVTFERDGAIGSFERPPPVKPTQRYIVVAVRDYLTRLGVAP